MYLKRFFLSLSAVLCVSVAMAQDEYAITSFEEMVGQNIVLYDVDLIDQEYGHVFSQQKTKKKGKKKMTVQKLDEENPDLYGVYKCNDIVTEKKKRYAVLVSGSKVLRLSLEDPAILQHLMGTRQMEAALDIARRKYQYKVNADFTEGYLSLDAAVWMAKKYTKVNWTGYTIPNKRSGKVAFNYSIGSKKYSVTDLDDVEGQFITESQYRSKYDEYQAQLDKNKMAIDADSLRDEATIIAYCGRHKVFYEEPTNEQDACLADTIAEMFVGDEVFPYAYDSETRTIHFFYRGMDLEADPLYINFASSADFQYLKRRGMQGLEVRRDIAFSNDRVILKEYLDEKRYGRKKE